MRWDIILLVLAFCVMVGLGVFVLIDVKSHPEKVNGLLIGINPFMEMGICILIIMIALLFIYFGGGKDV